MAIVGLVILVSSFQQSQATNTQQIEHVMVGEDGNLVGQGVYIAVNPDCPEGSHPCGDDSQYCYFDVIST